MIDSRFKLVQQMMFVKFYQRIRYNARKLKETIYNLFELITKYVVDLEA